MKITKPRIIQGQHVYIKIGDEILAILSRKTIFLNGNDKGRMKDGREVQKIDGLWYYIPKRKRHEKEKGPDIWQR